MTEQPTEQKLPTK